MEHHDHVEALSDVFFSLPDVSIGSLQVLKVLGPKSDQFRRAFRDALSASDAPITLVSIDAAHGVASELQAYAFTMTPEQAGRFAAEEVLRMARKAATGLQNAVHAEPTPLESVDALS